MVDIGDKIKVVVLMGGPSSEYEISLKTGENVVNHLDKNKYEVESLIISKKGEWPVEPLSLKKKFDVAFIAMHGPYGEGGIVQSILEEIDLPYTFSDSLSSALAMNKYLSLQIFRYYDLDIPYSIVVPKLKWQDMPLVVLNQIKHYLGYPVVVKPNDNGSSVATFIVDNEDSIDNAFNEVFSVSRLALIQPYIYGREVTCGVLDYGWPESAYALPPTEIIPKKSKFFDYHSKYSLNLADEITPARFSDPINKLIQKIAVKAHKILGCRGLSRTDMIVAKDKKIYILETNTIPGMTNVSLIPKAAEAAGISFSSLLDRIIQSALRIRK